MGRSGACSSEGVLRNRGRAGRGGQDGRTCRLNGVKDVGTEEQLRQAFSFATGRIRLMPNGEGLAPCREVSALEVQEGHETSPHTDV